MQIIPKQCARSSLCLSTSRRVIDHVEQRINRDIERDETCFTDGGAGPFTSSVVRHQSADRTLGRVQSSPTPGSRLSPLRFWVRKGATTLRRRSRSVPFLIFSLCWTQSDGLRRLQIRCGGVKGMVIKSSRPCLGTSSPCPVRSSFNPRRSSSTQSTTSPVRPHSFLYERIPSCSDHLLVLHSAGDAALKVLARHARQAVRHAAHARRREHEHLRDDL